MKNYLIGLLDNPDVILDIGAHVGRNTSMFAEEYPSAQIYAIEPVGESYNRLVESTKNYANVVTINVALSDKGGELWMGMPEPGDNLGMMRVGAVLRSEKVEAIPLDDLSLSPVFIKLDVEGYECPVILGGEKTFLSAELVQIERNRPAELLLISMGYKYVTSKHPDAYYRKV